MNRFFKRFYPLLCLFLVAGLAAAAVLVLGGGGLRHPDHDPARVRAGELLSRLRDGQTFSLAQVYPQAWDVAQFSTELSMLSEGALRKLLAYDPGMAQGDAPLLLLWREGELTDALPLPDQQDGYPRFQDGAASGDFFMERAEAWFLCTFVPGESGRGGYYRCTPFMGEET